MCQPIVRQDELPATYLSRFQKLNIVHPYLRALSVVANVVECKLVRHADGIPRVCAGV